MSPREDFSFLKKREQLLELLLRRPAAIFANFIGESVLCILGLLVAVPFAQFLAILAGDAPIAIGEALTNLRFPPLAILIVLWNERRVSIGAALDKLRRDRHQRIQLLVDHRVDRNNDFR